MAYFQYGLTTNYGSATSPTTFSVALGDIDFFRPLAYLTAGQRYHYRVVASNHVGTVYGSDQSFATPLNFSPPGSTFTGGDPGEGLDLQGTFVHAVNIGGNGAPGLVGDANFTTDSAPGVSLTAPESTVQTINPGANPNFGATANDDRLEQALRSIRYTAAPAPLTVTLGNLQAGRRYKLQLLFIEACCDGIFNVRVNGAMLLANFRFLDYGSSGTPLAITHTFTAGGTSAGIELGVTLPYSGDGTPPLSALTLEDLSTAGSRLPNAAARRGCPTARSTSASPGQLGQTTPIWPPRTWPCPSPRGQTSAGRPKPRPAPASSDSRTPKPQVPPKVLPGPASTSSPTPKRRAARANTTACANPDPCSRRCETAADFRPSLRQRGEGRRSEALKKHSTFNAQRPSRWRAWVRGSGLRR